MKRIKACVEAARFLREAGCHTELDLGQKAVSGYRWVLSLPEEGSFQLTDLVTGEKSELASPAELLGIMREAR